MLLLVSFVIFLFLAGLKAYHGLPVYPVTIMNTYPHDPDAFTQGLVFKNGFLYEGTGLNGKSSLRKIDIETGKILQMRQLPSYFFGEGITVFDSKIIQLTYRSRVGFVYDLSSFELIKTFTYPTEGWGLTHNGAQLIMSDGTATLFFLDPDSFAITGRLKVIDENGPVHRLNELEFVRGEIYANIWQTNLIARIDPKSGKVKAWIDIKGIVPVGDRKERREGVPNGIAYDEQNDRLFVTGKLWPKIFEIRIVPTNSD
jgi:glutamine cyclotransferase